jgi:ABC-type transport system substrate-binding protein
LAKFKRNAYLEFAANPNYYGGKPKTELELTIFSYFKLKELLGDLNFYNR